MNQRFLTVLGVVLCAASGAAFAKIPNYWPTREWRTSTPEEQGMDSKVLADMLEYIRENDLNVHSLTVIRHGYIVLDAYFWPTDSSVIHDIASCTKSITSTLVGIAQDKGYLDIDQRMLDFFPGRTVSNLDSRKEAITVEDLLMMTAGMECVNEPTEITNLQMQASPDFVQFALDLEMTDDPGSKWVYNSCGSHLLGAIVANASGISLEEFARANLFNPLGIDSVYWPQDPQGYNYGWGDIRMTPHDIAKIGFLFLHEGRWDGKQIVSRRFVRQATKPLIKLESDEGYGYQWWTYKYGAYQAVGRGGQRIFVLPMLDIIVVVTAGAAAEETSKYETALTSFVLPSIKSRSRPARPNPEAFILLQSRLREIVVPPPPDTVPVLPDAARRISGKTWLLDSNLAGWDAVKLEFENELNEAFVIVTINDKENRFPVGLDNVPRVTAEGSFAAGSRYYSQDVALKGRWVQDTFVIDFNTLSVIDRGTIKMNFTEKGVNVELFEKTFIKAPVTFTGKLKEQG